MGEFELKVEVKELPIGMLSENTGQIPECYKAKVQESEGNVALYVKEEGEL